MYNTIYADPCQNLCLMRWLEFTIEAFHTNSSTRLTLMHLSEVIMSTKKYGHLKKMMFYIEIFFYIEKNVIVQKLWANINMSWVYTKRIGS